MQWRQYETKIATRSAQQSESLKKSALLSKQTHEAEPPVQVQPLRLLRQIHSTIKGTHYLLTCSCLVSCFAALHSGLQVTGAVAGYGASPNQSRRGSPQRQQPAPADTSGVPSATRQSLLPCLASYDMSILCCSYQVFLWAMPCRKDERDNILVTVSATACQMDYIAHFLINTKVLSVDG